MARMDPWKRCRLLAWIVVMLAILAAGVYSRLMWGVPEYPYSYPLRGGTVSARSADPFMRLQLEMSYPP